MKTTCTYSNTFKQQLRNSFTLILILFSLGYLSAQSFVWIDAYPINYNNNPADLSSSVCTDQNENIYFAGLQSQISGSYGNIFIRKYDNALPLEVCNFKGS
jgi:hypothetical protein